MAASADLFADGHRFAARARAEGLGGGAAAMGALAWGLLGLLYESPCCPGHRLNPVDRPAGFKSRYWTCPACGKGWEWRNQPEPVVPATKPRATRARGKSR